MATAYGSYDTSAGYNAYRAVMDYSTSQTETQWTVSITGKVESGAGSDSLDNFALSLTIGDSTESKSSTSYMSAGSTVTFGSKSRTYSRGHSAVNCLIKAYAKNDGTYTGWTGSSTAQATVTIPAKPSYTVSFNANNGSGAPSSQTKWYGESLTLSSTKPTRTGYTFQGWGTSSTTSTVSYAAGASYTANAAITLYAVWKANTYTVSFNANGGSGAPSSQTKTYGVDLTLSSTKPTRTGYTFQGWGTSSTTSTVSYSAGGKYTANAAITLYAVWKINTWTVSYAANGGSGAPASQTKTYGTALTLRAAISHANATTTYTVTYNANSGSVSPSSATATKTTTYSFSKWKATDGTLYSASGSYTANAATTMTAQWTSSATTTSVTLPTPTRTGYTFAGWYTAATNGTKVGNAGANYTPSAKVTLYAHWTINTYTVSFNANGGSGAPASQTKTYNVALTLSSTKPTRTGHTFLGWGTSSTATSATYSAGGTVAASTNQNLPLYAVWKANTYTVSFNANGGSGAPSSQTKTYGVDLTLSSTKPTRTNYTFKGWGTSASTTTVSYSSGGKYTANAAITLYAVWELSYVAPKITKVTAIRCDSSGTAQDEGTYCKVTVKFTAGTNSVTGVTVKVGSTSASATISGSTATKVLGTFSVNSKYTVTASVTDGTKTASMKTVLTAARFPLDILAGGIGVAIGIAATIANTFEVALTTIFNNVSVNIKSLNLDRDGETPTANQFGRVLALTDVDGNSLGTIDSYRLTSGESGIRFIGYAGPSGESVYNTFLVGKKADGTNVYHANDPEAFREAINAVGSANQASQNAMVSNLTGTSQHWALRSNVINSNNTTYYGHNTGIVVSSGQPSLFDFTAQESIWTAYTTQNPQPPEKWDTYKSTTVSQVITAASGITVSSVTYAEWGKVAQLSVACTGFSASTGSKTVGTVVSGKRPVYNVYATDVSSSYAAYAQLTTAGALTVYWATAPSASTSYTIRFIYILA